MADWSSLVTAALGGGGVTGAIAFAKYLQDERRHRAQENRLDRAESREELDRPAHVQEQQLGLVDRATIIQQRAIETLEQQVEDLQLRHSVLKQESGAEIDALKADNRRLREQLMQVYQAMGEMEAELRRYRASGPAA